MCATVAVVNFRAIPGDCARNLQRIKEYTEAAARRGAQIILFPELALSGADDVAYAAAAAEPVPGPAGQAVARTAQRLDVYVAFGMAVQRDGKRYNSIVLCGPEGILGMYDKLHLTARDATWASPGEALPLIADTRFGRVLVATAYDAIYFPEVCRYGKAKGVSLMLSAAALTNEGMAGAWQMILERQVGLNTLHLATANLAGGGGFGGSQILSPGEPIEQARIAAGYRLDSYEGRRPGFYCAVIDMMADALMPHYPYFEHNYKVGTPDWRPDVYEAAIAELMEDHFQQKGRACND